MNKLAQRSFLNAFGTVAYIAIIGTVMKNGDKIFGTVDNALAPILFLTLFVLSAAITAGLVLGKPVLMFLSGAKEDAVKLFIFTLGWLAGVVIVLGLFSLK